MFFTHKEPSFPFNLDIWSSTNLRKLKFFFSNIFFRWRNQRVLTLIWGSHELQFGHITRGYHQVKNRHKSCLRKSQRWLLAQIPGNCRQSYRLPLRRSHHLVFFILWSWEHILESKLPTYIHVCTHNEKWHSHSLLKKVGLRVQI